MRLNQRILKTGLALGALSLGGCIWDLESLLKTEPATPLVGMWREQAAYSCSGQRINSREPFRELVFGDSSFTFTWAPFESYVDYWGTYSYNSESGEVVMSITGGNQIPEVYDLRGNVSFNEDGTLHLEDMFFGFPGVPWNDSTERLDERPCSYVIEEFF
ncbi:MAG: hypothetical protein ABIB47_04950 [Candidatus Woesearchaeota archaeon]